MGERLVGHLHTIDFVAVPSAGGKVALWILSAEWMPLQNHCHLNSSRIQSCITRMKQHNISIHLPYVTSLIDLPCPAKPVADSNGDESMTQSCRHSSCKGTLVPGDQVKAALMSYLLVNVNEQDVY